MRRKLAMGLIHVTVTLRAIEQSRRKFEADFLVDSRAISSMAPACELRRAGIRRRGQTACELADGSTVDYDFGLAEIECMGAITAGRVLFGPDDSQPRLGVAECESLGIAIDPATHGVHRRSTVPLKQAACLN